MWNCWVITSSDKFSTKYLHRFRMMNKALKVCHVNMLLERNLKDSTYKCFVFVCKFILSPRITSTRTIQVIREENWGLKCVNHFGIHVKSADLTYSSHCVEAFNSAARVKNTFISAEKFPVRQLLIAKFLQIIAVDSSNNLWSGLQ